MNIIELAKQAGFPAPELMVPTEGRYVSPDLSYFAALVRAQALEEAAGVCETEWSNVAEKMYGEECAAAIRALKGETT